MESTSVGVATRVRITAGGRITTDSEVGSGVAGIIAGVGLATGEFERIGDQALQEDLFLEPKHFELE